MPCACRPSRAPASSACAGPQARQRASAPPAVIPDVASAPIPQIQATDALFERALAHVLEMEGGYDEDPYDPGGPTNLGITLAEYARDKGVRAHRRQLRRLKAELKAIPRATVRRIYRDHYWLPAACPELPPPLALFHFDAAVNQGVAGAARMLQQAVGTDIDGEIGPLTLAAVASHPVDADAGRLRRGPPPALPRLPTSGASAKAGSPASTPPWRSPTSIDRTIRPSSPPNQRTTTHAHRHPSRPPRSATAPDAKWWGHSMTIWGIIVTTLSTVLPALGPVFGLNITAELIHQLGDNVVMFGQARGRPDRHGHGHLRPRAHQHAPGAAPDHAQHVTSSLNASPRRPSQESDTGKDRFTSRVP